MSSQMIGQSNHIFVNKFSVVLFEFRNDDSVLQMGLCMITNVTNGDLYCVLRSLASSFDLI